MIAQISRPTSDFSANHSAESVISQLLGVDWPRGRKIPTELSFVSAFAMLLLGVTLADGQITAEEKQRFKEILDHVLPPETKPRQVFQKVYAGIKSSKLHREPKALHCLIQLLGESERLLLLVLGYEIAMADGDLAGVEADYLETLAQRSGVDTSLLAAFQASLEPGAAESGGVDREALAQLRCELDPARFRNLHASFCRAAGRIVERLPKTSEQLVIASNTEEVSARTLHQSSGLDLSLRLRQHQAAQERLAQQCDSLLEVVQQIKGQISFAIDLESELPRLAEKARSQTFRVAIVGEFSQGKSTL